MENISDIPLNTATIQPDASMAALEDLAQPGLPPDSQSLSPSRRAELWSGRFAMVGFVTAIAAIAFRATI